MNEQLKEKLMVKSKWLRVVFMLIFCVIMYIVSWLILLSALFQFVWNLFADTTNEPLKNFTKSLNSYFYQIINFLTFNTEVKPFPFEHWPREEHKAEVTKPSNEDLPKE